MRTVEQASSANQSGSISRSSPDPQTRTGDVSTVGLHHCHGGEQPCRTSLRHAWGVSRVTIWRQAASIACDPPKSAKGARRRDQYP